MMKAFIQIFGANVQMKGCYFHHTNAVIKHARNTDNLGQRVQNDNLEQSHFYICII